MNTDMVVYKTPRIPTETWEEIFRTLSHPGDLYNVALTCRYVYDIVMPILYRRISLDQNPYLTYTLTLFKRDLTLAHRIQDLTLIPTIDRSIPPCLQTESETLYATLDLPHALPAQFSRQPPIPGTLEAFILLELQAQAERFIRPIFHFFPLFTGLITLHIVDECVPTDFFHWLYQLPQLTTLHIQHSIVATDLEEEEPPSPLPLRTLSILKCYTLSDLAEGIIPGKICDGLLKRAPLLTSLAVDLFIEQAACLVLSKMSHPPPIQTLSCHGMGPRDHNIYLLGATLINLPTITTLRIEHTPRVLGLPKKALPHLRNLAGQIKTLGSFFGVHRKVQYLTITDSPSVPSGSAPWETQLISLFETLGERNADLKGLTFSLAEWSEDVFLCICQFWPGLKELRMRCGKSGVDEYFRISFGPRFLPQLPDLEVLHIYCNESELSFWDRHAILLPIPNKIELTPEEEEELAEAQCHYRRWEKFNPSLREVAFYRFFWWRRVSSERGSWALMTEDVMKE